MPCLYEQRNGVEHEWKNMHGMYPKIESVQRVCPVIFVSGRFSADFTLDSLLATYRKFILIESFLFVWRCSSRNLEVLVQNEVCMSFSR